MLEWFTQRQRIRGDDWAPGLKEAYTMASWQSLLFVSGGVNATTSNAAATAAAACSGRVRP